MNLKEVLTRPQSSAIEGIYPEDEWEVVIAKGEKYYLTGEEVSVLKEISQKGYRGLVWFNGLAISIAHIQRIARMKLGNSPSDEATRQHLAAMAERERGDVK